LSILKFVCDKNGFLFVVLFVVMFKIESHLSKLAEHFSRRVHSETGCTYDGVAYDKHLDHVYEVYYRYSYLLDDSVKTFVECGIWLHDVMEDCRISYEELSIMFGVEVADLVYALTNELGKTRSDIVKRTYPKIRDHGDLAIFVKLCDRIANTEASLRDGNEKYRSLYFLEYFYFKQALKTDAWDIMWLHLDSLHTRLCE